MDSMANLSFLFLNKEYVEIIIDIVVIKRTK